MPKAKKQQPEVKPIQEIEEEFAEVDEQVIETKTKLLDQCLPYNEKVRLMTLEVLREECGWELARGAYASQKEFSWADHNAEFREDYKDASLKELMDFCSRLYGLKNLKEIRERRAAHKNLRSKRTSNNIDIEEDDDDDIDLD